jgi:hypothetical protein
MFITDQLAEIKYPGRFTLLATLVLVIQVVITCIAAGDDFVGLMEYSGYIIVSIVLGFITLMLFATWVVKKIEGE